jgi:hypothetical protein
MLGQDEWIKTRHLPPQPPRVLKPPERPKKLRRRDPDKLRNPYKVSRMNRHIKCEKRKKVGHNSRSCNVGITGETPWQRRQKIKATKSCKISHLYCYIFQYAVCPCYMHLNVFFFFSFSFLHWL